MKKTLCKGKMGKINKFYSSKAICLILIFLLPKSVNNIYFYKIREITERIINMIPLALRN